MSDQDLKHKAAIVRQRLLDAYGKPDWRPDYESMDELVLTMLSANTSDVNSGRAFEQLQDTYDSWDQVMNAPLDELIQVIRPGGLAPTKAPRIQAALRHILAERGEFEIDFLADLPLDEATRWLTALDGIGHKTASIVLLFCFGMPAFPVDTHVKRVSQRLGFAGDRASAETIKDTWEDLVPGEWFYDLHLNLIRHGRETCTARNPKCPVCPLQDQCDWYARQQPT